MLGTTVFSGYFSNAEATASTLDSKGWLRTGDLCYIDEDGFIFVVDRLKELIKYKGYQVSIPHTRGTMIFVNLLYILLEEKQNNYLFCSQVPPAELEALLLTHPEIADAAVIP